jgi:hypothetical protein
MIEEVQLTREQLQLNREQMDLNVKQIEVTRDQLRPHLELSDPRWPQPGWFLTARVEYVSGSEAASDVCTLRVEVLLGAPAQEDPQVRLGVQPSLAAVAPR